MCNTQTMTIYINFLNKFGNSHIASLYFLYFQGKIMHERFLNEIINIK